MNRALLNELQRRRAYPSVTLLANTTRGAALSDRDHVNLLRLADDVERRLTGDVDDATRDALVERVRALVESRRRETATEAVALCVSGDFATAVSLGRAVDERVVIDDTFATRDLVVDLNRTAQFRLLTVSERRARLFLGDRDRLVELRDEHWPLRRADEEGLVQWNRDVVRLLRTEHSGHPLPVVFAGSAATIRNSGVTGVVEPIGVIAGNHDRTGWDELQRAAWPIVNLWLESDRDHAFGQLDAARSSRRFAGGIDEIWDLASEGRVDLLVVEDGYRLAVRVAEGVGLVAADDPEAPDVVDDIVDETIEVVLNKGGRVVVVADGELAEVGRIAGTLRY